MPLHLLPPAVGAEQARRAVPGPAVVLLDLGLPDASAYTLAHEWAETGQGAGLVLILPSIDCRPEAARLRAADLLLPPVHLDRLAQALRSALARIGPPGGRHEASRPALVARSRNGDQAVPVDQVVYLRADGKYVNLRTRSGAYLIERPLADLARSYPDRFVQVHRNALVARTAIAGARRVTPELTGCDADPYWELVLDGVPERIAVARRRWPLVRRCLPGDELSHSLMTEAT